MGTADKLFLVAWAEWLDRLLPNLACASPRRSEIVPEEMPDLIAAEARRLLSVQ
jgi:hypothetical protein